MKMKDQIASAKAGGRFDKRRTGLSGEHLKGADKTVGRPSPLGFHSLPHCMELSVCFVTGSRAKGYCCGIHPKFAELCAAIHIFANPVSYELNAPLLSPCRQFMASLIVCANLLWHRKGSMGQRAALQ